MCLSSTVTSTDRTFMIVLDRTRPQLRTPSSVKVSSIFMIAGSVFMIVFPLLSLFTHDFIRSIRTNMNNTATRDSSTTYENSASAYSIFYVCINIVDSSMNFTLENFPTLVACSLTGFMGLCFLYVGVQHINSLFTTHK